VDLRRQWRSLQCPRGKLQYDYHSDNEELRGLTLRVRASGVNTWFYQYRAPLPSGRKGKTERVTIGRAGAPPLLDFEGAKGKYISLAMAVGAGRNPADDNRNAHATPTHSGAMTVEACFHDFLEEEYGASTAAPSRLAASKTSVAGWGMRSGLRQSN